jgi:putative heme-binding domain-containing protein
MAIRKLAAEAASFMKEWWASAVGSFRRRREVARWRSAGLACLIAFIPIGSVAAQETLSRDPALTQTGHNAEPVSPADIRVPAGFVVEKIVSIPPALGSLTTMTVDDRGRIIAAAQHVPGFIRITPAPADGSAGGTVVEKLEGAAARIGWCQGLLYAFDSLYVTVAEKNDVFPTGVYRLRDIDGDGQFESVIKLFELTGQGEHGPHNLVVSPDGRSVYFIAGNATKLPAGVRLARPVATVGVDRLMPPGFQSSRYTVGGWLVRFDPDGGNLELMASGMRNAYDLAFNRAGDAFTFDSDTEGDLGTAWYRPTRICHLVSGAEFGWRGGTAPWPDYLEDGTAPVLNVGPSSPTGMVFGDRTHFPARYREALFACDWTYGTIHAFFLKPQGSGYQAIQEDFLSGNGLPLTDIVVGRDGALYFSTGGRRLASAVYRVRAESPREPGAAPDESAVPPLHQLRRELEARHGRRDPATVEAAWPWLGHEDRGIRFAARVALEHQPVGEWRTRALAEKDPDAQIAALLALVRHDEGDPDAILAAAATLAGSGLSPDRLLRVLRIVEWGLARSEGLASERRRALREALRPAFPAGNGQLDAELARVLAVLGDETIIAPVLAGMESDTGDQSYRGADFFARNPRYGKTLGDMAAAAPYSRRMQFAHALLWLEGGWTPAQTGRYFELLAAAANGSKGGRLYYSYWHRIQQQALRRIPPAEKAALAPWLIPEIKPDDPVGSGILPKGPGRAWTVAEALAAAAGGLQGRDLKNGRAMYVATGCQACHQRSGEGGAIGPDISALGRRFSLRDTLEAIIEPNRAISDQYAITTLRTKSGRRLSGIISSRDSEAVRISTNPMMPGQTESVATAEIVEEVISPVSLMPEGLLNPLSEAELKNLLAYLLEDSAGQDTTKAAR